MSQSDFDSDSDPPTNTDEFESQSDTLSSEVNFSNGDDSKIMKHETDSESENENENDGNDGNQIKEYHKKEKDRVVLSLNQNSSGQIQLFPTNLTQDRPRKIRECSFPGCGAKFLKLESLEQHQLLAHQEIFHVCQFCFKAFKGRFLLEQHKKIHTKTTPRKKRFKIRWTILDEKNFTAFPESSNPPPKKSDIYALLN